MSDGEAKPKKPARISPLPSMDIVKPGAALPNASARPIIVGHKPMVQDPMVNDSTAVGDRFPERSSVARSAPKVITPIVDDADLATAEDVVPVEEAPVAPEVVNEVPYQEAPKEVSKVVTVEDNSEPQEVPENTVEAAAAEVQEEVTPQVKVDAIGPTSGTELQADPSMDEQEDITEPSETVADESTGDEKNQESAVIDAVVGQASAKNVAAKQAEADKLRLDEQDKLIDSKEFFVPIGERRRKKRRIVALVLVLVVLVMLGGGYVFMDKFTNISLPYEFFTSAEQRQPSQVGANTPSANTDEGTEVVKEEVYINKEFGFQFVLPAGFATSTEVDRVVILDGTKASLAESGHAFRIDISPKFVGGFVTKDWKALPRPPVELVEPAPPPLGFVEYPACKPAGTYTKVLFEDEKTCVFASALQDNQNPNGMYTISVRKKLKLEQVAGLEFAESPVVLERYTRQAFEAALQTNKSRIQDIITFAQSIKALQ